MSTATDLPPAFDEWCVIELMGHRRIVGRVREATFPAGFLRIDEPDLPADPDGATWVPGRTQVVSPSALYAMHPISKDAAHSLAQRWRDDPVSPWDLERAGWQKITAGHAIGDGVVDAHLEEEDEDSDDPWGGP